MAQSTQAVAADQPTTTQPTDTGLGQRIRWNVADTFVMTRRNLTYYLRQPQLLVFATVQPVMFLLLFTFVFGGAISLGGPEAGAGAAAAARVAAAARIFSICCRGFWCRRLSSPPRKPPPAWLMT